MSRRAWAAIELAFRGGPRQFDEPSPMGCEEHIIELNQPARAVRVVEDVFKVALFANGEELQLNSQRLRSYLCLFQVLRITWIGRLKDYCCTREPESGFSQQFKSLSDQL